MPSKVEIKLHKLPPGQKWPSLTRESNAEKNKEIEKQTTLSDRSTPTPSVNDAKNATQPSAPLKPTPDPIKEKAPAYPTSSRTGPKNWDAIAAESLKSSSSKDKDKGANELDGMDDEEGDPLNAFFKQLYAKSDPDTRRAMMKSYTESGGTALSTNWDEVGKARVKVSPPEGMVEKKFEA
jgi:suppressor of G2 allele of SKP1